MRPSFMILRPKIGGKGVRLKRGLQDDPVMPGQRKGSLRHRPCRRKGKMIEMRVFARIPWEVSEIERFRRAMGKGGIVPFHCRSPFVFLIYAGHGEHAALLKIGLACRGGRQTLEKVRSQRADLRAWRQAGRRLIGGHRRSSEAVRFEIG